MVQAHHTISLPFAALILVLCCLQACAVGIMNVEGPELSPAKEPVSLDRDVSFEVCIPEKLRNTGWHNAMNKKIAAVLKRDFAVDARPETPAADKPYFHFILVSKTDNRYVASALISFLSLGALPGYAVDQTQVNVAFAARDASGGMAGDKFTYEYRERYFLWLPLILYPDILVGINGGYINENKKNRGLELVLNRFMHDASERMKQPHQEAELASHVLKCPDE